MLEDMDCVQWMALYYSKLLSFQLTFFVKDLVLYPYLANVPEKGGNMNGVYQVFFQFHLYGDLFGEVGYQMVVIEEIPVIHLEDLKKSVCK